MESPKAQTKIIGGHSNLNYISDSTPFQMSGSFNVSMRRTTLEIPLGLKQLVEQSNCVHKYVCYLMHFILLGLYF